MDGLRDRAIALLRAAGGQLPASALAHALFGGSSPAWNALLERLLDDDCFQRAGDCWQLVAPPSERTVALVLLTTGQDPTRHALVWVGACDVGPAGPGATFSTLVDPGRRFPGWLAERLASELATVEALPSPPTALTALRQFLGEATVVGFDLGWAWPFLQAQYRLAGLPPLTNPVRDLLPEALAVRGGAKPTLRALAEHVGLPSSYQHPREEARLIAQLASRLASAPPPATTTMLARARHLPDSPGVYLFRDAAGAPLYVGTASRLRRRVLGYLTRPPDHERELRGLPSLSASLEWEEHPDSLAAALREAELLAQLQPRFNIQRQVAPARRYLELNVAEPYPRLRQVAEPAPYRFGPYPSASAARRLGRLVSQVFALRVCTRRLPPRRRRAVRPPCPLLGRGRCLGPCQQDVHPEYTIRVAGATAVLSGNLDLAIPLVQQRAREALARGDRQLAERCHQLLRLLSEQPLAGEGVDLAILPPATGPQRVYVIQAGALTWAGPLAELAGGQLRSPSDPQARQQGSVALRWLATNRGRARTVPLPPAAPAPAVATLVRTAVATPETTV